MASGCNKCVDAIEDAQSPEVSDTSSIGVRGDQHEERQQEQHLQEQQHQPSDAEFPLCSNLIGLVVLAMAQSDLAVLRLSSRQFAAAIDPLIRTITLHEWPVQSSRVKRFCNVTRLNMEAHLSEKLLPAGSEATGSGSGSTDGSGDSSKAAAEQCWHTLLQLVAQLPHLRSLRLPSWDLDGDLPPAGHMPNSCISCLTGLTRLDLDEISYLPAGVQLPGLRAASFLSNEFPASLASIAAFAPNLQQLGCRRLEITIPTAGAPPAAAVAGADEEQPANPQQQQQPADAAAAAAAVATVLPKCTHFGGQAVTVPAAATPGQAAQAFGAAFPGLRVMYRVPQVSGSTGKEAGYDDLLAHLPLLTAIRGRNWFSSRSWFLIRGSGHLASEHWQKVTRLSFHSNSYPDGCSDFLDISKSTQLQELRLTFNYPFTKADELVRELEKLPRLRRLALPAALLCGRCCPEKHYPGLRQGLEALAAKTSLIKLDLITLPEATMGTTFFCGHSASVKEGMQALRAKAAAVRGQLAAVQQQQRQQKQQQQLGKQAKLRAKQLQLQQSQQLELELKIEAPDWADDCYLNKLDTGHKVWGMYVAANEW